MPQGTFPRYLVVNGDESEPGTYKDRLLMERDPHQLIEGVLLAAYAIGAGQAFIYVRGEMALAQERVAAHRLEVQQPPDGVDHDRRQGRLGQCRQGP